MRQTLSSALISPAVDSCHTHHSLIFHDSLGGQLPFLYFKYMNNAWAIHQHKKHLLTWEQTHLYLRRLAADQ